MLIGDPTTTRARLACSATTLCCVALGGALLGSMVLSVGCDAVSRAPRQAGVDGEALGGRAVACPTTSRPTTLDALRDRFVEGIYPLMTREEGGCTGCHMEDSPGTRRQMLMADNAPHTFYRLRGDGYFGLEHGKMPARVLSGSMPDKADQWTLPERETLRAFACDLAVVDADTEPDEEFPPELLDPYEGPAPTSYDNTFLTYDQLRGRVLTTFDDAWVREGVDVFSQNISLFGGVDFVSAFVPARQATAEFLVGLDILAEDVCLRAATDHTGPFVGVDTEGPIADATPSSSHTYEAEGPEVSILGLAPDCQPGPGATAVGMCNNSSLNVTVIFPAAGDYVVTVRTRGQPNPSGAPLLVMRVDAIDIASREVPETDFVDAAFAPMHVEAGSHVLTLAFTNDSVDGGDRNLIVDSFTLAGPVAGTTDGTADGRGSALDRIAVVFERMLLRAPTRGGAGDEVEPLYSVLNDLAAFEGDRTSAFSGVCEALMHHPDFLFTRPAAFDVATGGDRERALLIKSAFDLVDRPPNADELAAFDAGQDRAEQLDAWLQSDTFAGSYYRRIRQVLESDGSLDGDEPARLWTYITTHDAPIKDVLTATYTVSPELVQVERSAEHGATGVLTMRGYISGKPGLPHYNYAARVLTGFMGVVFDVPQAALDARATATASSTVDPTSICYSCHRLLTPLAHQRLKWDDSGNYRESLDGVPIDDSDRGLVEGYPYAGNGIQAFSQIAVKKRNFLLRMANVHFQFSFGRNLRESADERGLYLDLWRALQNGNGTFRDVIRTIHLSHSYTDPPPPTP